MLAPRAGSRPPPLGFDCLRAGCCYAGCGLAGHGHTGFGLAGRGHTGCGHTGFGFAGRSHSGSDCLETQWLKYELEVVVLHFLFEMLNHNVAWAWWSFFVAL